MKYHFHIYVLYLVLQLHVLPRERHTIEMEINDIFVVYKQRYDIDPLKDIFQ